jgi:hypothetical protein
VDRSDLCGSSKDTQIWNSAWQSYAYVLSVRLRSKSTLKNSSSLAGRSLRQQMGAMAMDAAGRALTARAQSGTDPLTSRGPVSGGAHAPEPETPHHLWNSGAPSNRMAAQRGGLAIRGLPRVQSGSVLPLRGGVWDQPPFPDPNRNYSNPNLSQQPLSSENQSAEINQGVRASQDFSGSLDARKGSISDTPTPERQASGSLPSGTGGQSTLNLSSQSERFRALSGGPQSSDQQARYVDRNVGQSANKTPVSSDMHAPKEPVRSALNQEARSKRVRSGEDFGPPSKKGRGLPGNEQGPGSQEQPVPQADVRIPHSASEPPVEYRIVNSRIESQQDTKPTLGRLVQTKDGVKTFHETRTGSSGLDGEGIHSGEGNRVDAIMAELGNMSRDYVSVLASSGLSEIGPSHNQLPSASLPATSIAATSSGVPAESLQGETDTCLPHQDGRLMIWL